MFDLTFPVFLALVTHYLKIGGGLNVAQSIGIIEEKLSGVKLVLNILLPFQCIDGPACTRHMDLQFNNDSNHRARKCGKILEILKSLHGSQDLNLSQVGNPEN